MSTAVDALLAIHVAAGFVALAAGFVAMTTRKGRRYHLLAGRVYFWSMAVVAGTAVPVAIARSNVFLLAVAVFSFYLAVGGYRVVIRRRRGDFRRVSLLDRVATTCVLLASAGLILYGVGPGNGDVTAIVFGVIGAILGARDLREFRRAPATDGEWWRTHMVGMLGAYIATFTAFAVTNLTVLPPYVRWLGPTVVGSVGIVVWVRRYRASSGPDVEKPAAAPTTL